MASPNLSEIVTTTLRKRNKELADNVSKGNVLLKKLSMKGNIRPVDGGRTIVEELEYAENATFGYYTGYETLDVSPSDVMTAAEFDWKQAYVNVVASGLEVEVQNAGRERIINLLEKRIQNAVKTAKNQTTVGLYSDGTGSNGKQIGGLQHIVALDPATGVVGGINRANYSFWQNQTSGDVADIDTDFADLKSEMEDMWLECSRGDDRPDLIVADKVLFKNYWNGLTELQRFSTPDVGELGFPTLKFNTADVVYEDSTGIRDNTMYFLNTDYLYFRPHTNRNWSPMEKREPVNQDALVIPLLFAGNLTCSNASLQGVVYT